MYLSVLGMKLICKYEIGLSEGKIGSGLKESMVFN